MKKRINKFIKDKRYLVLLGILAIGVAAMAAMAWADNRGNIIMAMGFILFTVGGGALIYLGTRPRFDDVAIVLPGGAVKDAGKAALFNSLNIYAQIVDGVIRPERIAFEDVKKPLGQPQECLNLSGKWFYVHLFDLKTNKLKPLILPDGQYFDPREMASVLKMAAHKRLFTRRATLMQQIGPWIMVAAFVVAWIGFVASIPPA